MEKWDKIFYFMRIITSAENPKVREAMQLRESRQRRKRGLFLIDGFREVAAAVRGGITLEQIFIPESAHASVHATCDPKIIETACEVIIVSDALFQRMTFGDRQNSILAVAVEKSRTLETLILSEKLPEILSEKPIIAVVERIEKPGNIGALFRSADGAGIDAIIIADALCDFYNPAAIRASLGTIFTVPSAQATSEETLQFLQNHSFTIYAARCDAESLYHQVTYSPPVAIVLGNEANGLSPLWSQAKICGIRLPMRGIADCLNISAAASVLFYHACAQSK